MARSTVCPGVDRTLDGRGVASSSRHIHSIVVIAIQIRGVASSVSCVVHVRIPEAGGSFDNVVLSLGGGRVFLVIVQVVVSVVNGRRVIDGMPSRHGQGRAREER